MLGSPNVRLYPVAAEAWGHRPSSPRLFDIPIILNFKILPQRLMSPDVPPHLPRPLTVCTHNRNWTRYSISLHDESFHPDCLLSCRNEAAVTRFEREEDLRGHNNKIWKRGNEFLSCLWSRKEWNPTISRLIISLQNFPMRLLLNWDWTFRKSHYTCSLSTPSLNWGNNRFAIFQLERRTKCTLK